MRLRRILVALALIVSSSIAFLAAPPTPAFATGWTQNEWHDIGTYEPGDCVADFMFGTYVGVPYAKVHPWGSPFCNPNQARIIFFMSYVKNGVVTKSDTCYIDPSYPGWGTYLDQDGGTTISKCVALADMGSPPVRQIQVQASAGAILSLTLTYYPNWWCGGVRCADPYANATSVLFSAL